MLRVTSAAICMTATLASQASGQRLPPETLSSLMANITAICRGGTLAGRESSMSGSGTVNAGTAWLTRRFAELGIEGDAEFSESEWEGIRPGETFDPERYQSCVEAMTDRLIPDQQSALDADFGEVKVSSGDAVTACNPDSLLRVSVYHAGAQTPRQRIALTGPDLKDGRTDISAGQTVSTLRGCDVSLVRTGRDGTFFAILSRR
ncbi:MAG: hypothetical protein AAF919_05085 [Pseudomonadota bacterium]